MVDAGVNRKHPSARICRPHPRWGARAVVESSAVLSCANVGKGARGVAILADFARPRWIRNHLDASRPTPYRGHHRRSVEVR